jgi:hypothetical protein
MVTMALTDWADLAAITMEVNRLQSRRQQAKAAEDFKLLQAISDDLMRATTARDALLARIAHQIGAGGQIEAPVPWPPQPSAIA